jgi:hypothetical protein
MTFFQVFWGRKRAMTKSQINQSVIALLPHPSMQGGHFEGGTTEKSFWKKHQFPNGWQCAKPLTDFSVIPLRFIPSK